MNVRRLQIAPLLVLGIALAVVVAWEDRDPAQVVPPDRREVVFWHFWGGRDRAVVEDIVARFNASQDEHFVRAIAMPGNNLDLKFFLSVAGGDPPDLLNQDDPIVADWALRGVLMPIDELASEAEQEELRRELFPAARKLGEYDGRLYALCNGLDVRVLYYNKTLLDAHGLAPPTTWDNLNRINAVISPPDEWNPTRPIGYLPDPRRLWAWGIVFGGRFYDEAGERVTANQPPITRALDWMRSFSEQYGADRVSAFRTGDQSLTGAASPLLQGRYAVVMDGQWRVREIMAAAEAARREGRPVVQYGVTPLPAPPGGKENAGWVNGNLFVVPRAANNPEGAWAFMKFWCGLAGHEAEAARACVAGGWIPPTRRVTQHPLFQQYLQDNPLFETFVDLARSENQVPRPVVPGSALFDQELVGAAERAMYRDDAAPSQELLDGVTRRVQQRIEELADEPR